MIDPQKIRTYPLSTRKNKVSIDDFVKPSMSGGLPANITDIFPDILAGKDIKDLVNAIQKCRREKKEFVLMMGAHAIKCGLSPLIIEMLKNGIITHLAGNGAVAIHDFEIALIGETSEDVAIAIEDGSFGMAHETGYHLNQAYIRGAEENRGMGESVIDLMKRISPPHRDYSIINAASKSGVPVTIHTSIGTDIIHQHPSCNGSALGKTSYHDFLKFADTLSRLEGGIIFNLGSAVILPEVFLKALTVVRNLGREVKNFTAVNLDMIDHYRPRVNVLNRPTQSGGKRIFLRGSMEILIPLIYYGVFADNGDKKPDKGKWIKDAG